MKSDTKRGLVLAALIVAGLLLSAYDVTIHTPPRFPMDRRPEHPIPGDIEIFYIGKTVISTINVALLAFLLFTYIELYRTIESEFTVALMIFSGVLLLYALASNPIVFRVFGFRAFGLGPFAILPDIFSCIAISVLVYLSFKY